jgi:hypothetical protein
LFIRSQDYKLIKSEIKRSLHGLPMNQPAFSKRRECLRNYLGLARSEFPIRLEDPEAGIVM